ncbi:hypothetical protein [Corallococcus sp. 4LFB]
MRTAPLPPNEQDAGLQAVRERAHAAIQDKGAVWWNPPPPDVTAG